MYEYEAEMEQLRRYVHPMVAITAFRLFTITIQLLSSLLARFLG